MEGRVARMVKKSTCIILMVKCAGKRELSNTLA